MGTKTLSFITESTLKTTSADESTTLVRLDAGRQLYHLNFEEGLNSLRAKLLWQGMESFLILPAESYRELI